MNNLWLANLNHKAMFLVKSIAICTAIIVLSNVPLPLRAAEQNFDINSDWEMDRRYDWVINIKVIDSNYLGYPGSKLKSLTKLAVSYRLNPRFGEEAGKFVKYEDLWYHDGHAIGCRRLNELDIPATYEGAIRIIPSTAASSNSGAISGGIVRLLLDIGLKNCVLNAVFIPRDAYGTIINDLTRFNFSSTVQVGTTPIKIPLYSNPLYTNPVTFTDTLYFCQQ